VVREQHKNPQEKQAELYNSRRRPDKDAVGFVAILCGGLYRPADVKIIVFGGMPHKRDWDGARERVYSRHLFQARRAM